MRVIDNGHTYELVSLDGYCPQSLRFVKREGKLYPGNIGAYPGTTTQEVLRALIDRSNYVNGQRFSIWTFLGKHFMRMTIICLEIRAKRVKGKYLPIFSFIKIEEYKTCLICGHILCTEIHNQQRKDGA